MIKTKKQRAIDAYNKGLKAKYAGDWLESLTQNQLADKLHPGDEATIWNLGIAATALHEWDEARRAWRAYGIETNDGPGEVLTSPVTGCVRIDPDNRGEVVWGTRIDPARIRLLNVPLPESGRRYGDILLNDGAPEGTRKSGKSEYPVFNELGIWKTSPYSTYEVDLIEFGSEAIQSLKQKCDHANIGFEDWGTIRILCAACSRGEPGEHTCSSESIAGHRFAFAATSEASLRKLINEWRETEPDGKLGEIKLVVPGVSA